MNAGGSASVVGGENPTLEQTAIPGQLGIAYGSMSTEGLYTFPTATVAAWQSYVSAVPITGTSAVRPSPTSKSGAVSLMQWGCLESHLFLVVLLLWVAAAY